MSHVTPDAADTDRCSSMHSDWAQQQCDCQDARAYRKRMKQHAFVKLQCRSRVRMQVRDLPFCHEAQLYSNQHPSTLQVEAAATTAEGRREFTAMHFTLRRLGTSLCSRLIVWGLLRGA